jgi:hypothetical protein
MKSPAKSAAARRASEAPCDAAPTFNPSATT